MKHYVPGKTIYWKDLTILNKKEKFIELTVHLPWLFLSLLFAWYKLYFLALPCSFMFFLTSLRQSHNAFHYALGVSKKITSSILYLNSIGMLSSLHAVKFNHLRHHQYCLQKEDVEGKAATMAWWKAILYGPFFIFKLHYKALLLAPPKVKKIIAFELILIIIFITVVFYQDFFFLKYHIYSMIVGEFLSGFFAVWTVHHDCDEKLFSRTSRRKILNFFTYNMFYHTEHHLFPAVPAIKLPLLANRLDEKFPQYKEKAVF